MRSLALLGLLLTLGCKEQPRVFLALEGRIPMAAAFCADRLLVADTNENVVLIYDGVKKLIKTVTDFRRPMDIACNDDRIFVADFHLDQIIVLDQLGERVSSFGKHGAKPGEFKAPAGLALSGDTLYVAEFYGGRVQKFTLQGKPIGFVGDQTGKKMFTYPTAVHVDNAARVVVADTYAHQVKFFTKNKLVRTLSKKQFGFNVPTGVFSHGANLYVADSGNFRVLQIKGDGIAHLVWGHEKTVKRYSPSRVLLHNEELLIVDNINAKILSIPEGGHFEVAPRSTRSASKEGAHQHH